MNLMRLLLGHSLWSLIASFTIFASTAQAQVVAKSETGVGEGLSRHEAVAEALIEAAGKAFGIRISSEKMTSLKHSTKSDESGDKSELIELCNKAISSSVRTPGNRPILSYDVLSAAKVTATRWRAKVRIRYSAYQELGGQSARRTMVVVPMNSRDSAEFSEKVQQALVSTRKFDVLTRSMSTVFAQEKAFLRSEDAATGEIARLANVKGADYLFLVDLRDLSLTSQTDTVALTGETTRYSYLTARIRGQVLEMASHEVKWVKTIDVAIGVPNGTAGSTRDLVEALMPQAVELVTAMVDTIYPIRVVSSSGGRLTINRGGDNIREGDLFDVYQLGMELKDPQSGESLGKDEHHVAIAEVVDVKPKFSVLAVKGGVQTKANQQLLVRPYRVQPQVEVSVDGEGTSDPNHSRNQRLLSY